MSEKDSYRYDDAAQSFGYIWNLNLGYRSRVIIKVISFFTRA